MDANSGKTPVTMLSGFLGSGKTTLLRYLLENSKQKIACVVNDVASINIDAKLVRNDRNRANVRGDQTTSTKDLADTIELQNGCACCNLQDELFASFEQIMAMADKRNEPYARIVLENSGVAEPSNIRDKFREAEEAGHPLLDRIYLDTLITVVDASTFGQDFASRQPLAARPDLGDGGNLRPIVDLLVEQIECADYVILNKTDLLPAPAPPPAPAPLDELVAIVSSLNPLATVVHCSQAQVPLDVLFGKHAHAVVAKLNVEGQHRGAVAAARACESAEVGHKHAHHDHDHDHDHHNHHHNHGHGEEEGPETKRVKEDHHHGHDHHSHSHDHDHHSHNHDHDHHSHNHAHADAAGHDDAAAKHEHKHSGDGEHAHHHHHHHHATETDTTRAAQRFGIRSFVYSRRRPFHPQRLKEMVLKWLPVKTNSAIDSEAPELGDSPIKTVVRSKGFMWMSNSHSTAYYWSHAGQHFEIRDEGDWWCAVPEEDWPTDDVAREVIVADWDMSGAFGDRRQEIVFIGVRMDQDKISAQLDGALLTDDELALYVTRWASIPDPAHSVVDAYKKKAKPEQLNPEHHHDHADTNP